MRRFLVIGLALISCGDDESKKADSFGRYLQKLRDCGVVSKDGKLVEPEEVELGPVELCLQKCVLEASCAELSMIWCDQGPSDRLSDCVDDCDPPFQCRDASTSDAFHCDGYEDCEDGSDEDGCSASLYFVCDDGERFPKDFECDGEHDCSDDSDERDCEGAALFSCGSGQKIPEDYECDGEADCTDGSDESSCAGRVFACGDGQTVALNSVCDLFEDCEDGSDEAQGCAALICAP